jgi:GH43 family beta-xylosidase
MTDPVALDSDPVRLSISECDWEKRGFLVNDGRQRGTGRNRARRAPV